MQARIPEEGTPRVPRRPLTNRSRPLRESRGRDPFRATRGLGGRSAATHVRFHASFRLRHTVSFQLAGVSALGPSSMCQRHGPDPKKGRDAGWCRLRTDLGMR